MRETSLSFFNPSSETVNEMGSWSSQPQDCVSFGVWLCSRSWFLSLPDSSQRKAMGFNKFFSSLRRHPESMDAQGSLVQTGNVCVAFRCCVPLELLTNPATLSGGPNFLEAQWWLPVSVLGERKSLNYPLF